MGQITVLQLNEGQYRLVRFSDFCQLTLRKILAIDSEYILRIGNALFATGNKTLLRAFEKEPHAAFAFHECLNLLSCWESCMMDMKLLDLPIHLYLSNNTEMREMLIARTKGAFSGAEVVGS